MTGKMCLKPAEMCEKTIDFRRFQAYFRGFSLYV